MGEATVLFRCGCQQTRLMEPIQDVWITWVRCAEHYIPGRDDALVVEAARNRRVYEEQARRAWEVG